MTIKVMIVAATDVTKALDARWSTCKSVARAPGDIRLSIPLAGPAPAVRTSASLNRLERATEANHAAADASWLALMSPTIHERAYMKQLAIAYGFESPVESAFAYTAGLDDVIPLRKRLRAGLIAQDLLALGATASELALLPQCSSITPFVELSDALGWMFVFERAALLHDGVRRSVTHRLPRAAHAVSYLGAAGSVAGVRWQNFGTALERFAVTAALADQIADAANHAFRSWLEWVETNDQGPTWSQRIGNA